MDRLLESIFSDTTLLPVATEGVAATAARRERHRARVRLAHQAEICPPKPSAIQMLEVAEAIAIIRSSLARKDWVLLAALANGHSVKEVSEAFAANPVQLRVRAFRLRQKIGTLLAKSAA